MTAQYSLNKTFKGSSAVSFSKSMILLSLVSIHITVLFSENIYNLPNSDRKRVYSVTLLSLRSIEIDESLFFLSINAVMTKG